MSPLHVPECESLIGVPKLAVVVGRIASTHAQNVAIARRPSTVSFVHASPRTVAHNFGWRQYPTSQFERLIVSKILATRAEFLLQHHVEAVSNRPIAAMRVGSVWPLCGNIADVVHVSQLVVGATSTAHG